MSLLKIEIPSELELTLRSRAANLGQDLEVFVLDVLKDVATRPEPSALPHDQEEERSAATAPASSEESREDDEDQAPWRGVFVIEPHRALTISTAVSLRLSDLPRWRPEIVVSPRWLDTDSDQDEVFSSSSEGPHEDILAINSFNR
jgi:hypothetical protein